MDLRQLVVNKYELSTLSMRLISERYNVSIASISRWTHDIKMKDLHQKRKSKFTMVSSYLKELVESNPLLTLKALKKKIEHSFNLQISVGRIWIYLQFLKFSKKKVRKVTICDKNTRELKDQFIKRVNEKGRKATYALDEVGFRLEMYPNRGWSKKGSRCNYSSRIKSHKNVNAIFMIFSRGVVSYKLYEKAIKGDTFIEFLNSLDPNAMKEKTIVMDNLRVHHMKAVKELCHKLNVSLEYTTPYSPELNPIEEMFSWIKIKLRSITIKTVTELKTELEKLIIEINQRGLEMYYNHSYGYQ